jgi:DNA-binding PadR family transcriptional regulator
VRKLANVELMLLELIFEGKEVSGYEINALVEKRGFREWADIGTTSIYIGLKKLEQKGLLESYVNMEKKGRGPLPRYFRLNKKGIEILKDEIFDALSTTRERDRRFDLGLAGIPFITRSKAISAFQTRKDFLKREKKRVNIKFEEQGGKKLPLSVRKIFEHPLYLMDQEIVFIDSIIKDLKKEVK